MSLFRSDDVRGHAPMAGYLQRVLVGRDFGIEFLGVALRLGIEVGEVEPGAARGARQMVATVPVARAAPDQLRHLVAKGESLAPPRCPLADARQPMTIGMFRRNLAVRDLPAGRFGTRGAQGT